MEIDGFVADVQRDHGIESGEKQSVWDFDFAAGYGDGDVAITENGFRLPESEDQMMQFHQFFTEFRIELIGFMTFRAEGLEIVFCDIRKIEFHYCVAIGLRTDEIKLRFALFCFHDDSNSPVPEIIFNL